MKERYEVIDLYTNAMQSLPCEFSPFLQGHQSPEPYFMSKASQA
jgi:hypothetical protein